MSTLQSLSASPVIAIAAFVSLLVLVLLVTRKKYRLRVRKSGFEFLIEPHDPTPKLRARGQKADEV